MTALDLGDFGPTGISFSSKLKCTQSDDSKKGLL